MKKLSLLLFLVGILACKQAIAFQSFQIKSIRIVGLQRVSEGAVLNDLPVRAGETLTETRSTEIIKVLYKTGFFKQVTLEREGDVLVIRVVERPTISKLVLNDVKDKDKVVKLLREAGISEGRLYDPAAVIRAQKELEHYYLSKGKYGVKIEPTVTEEGSLITLKFDIFEGDVAKIKQIKIVGNNAFTEKELTQDFHTGTSNWLSWFTSKDKYAKEKLNADLETLRSYYLDRGYLQFQIESTEVSLTPDKKNIYVTIHVQEGEKYHFGNVSIDGQTIVPKAQLTKFLKPIQNGQTFSRKTLLNVKKAIEDRLGKEGYHRAEARMAVEANDQNKTVSVNFHIAQGNRVYVRHIEFVGNLTTKDEVLRRELPQMEGTWISSCLIEEGKENIIRRFGGNVEVETLPVAECPDQVDVIYNVEEAKLGQIGAGVSYSAAEKLMFNFSISQENFFGTGKSVDFQFDNSRANTNYSIGYMDPYFTVDRIGMGASAYYSKTDLSRVTHFSRYATDTWGGDLRWIFPLGRYEAIKLGLGYDNLHLKFDPKVVAGEVIAFTNKYGTNYKEWKTSAAWLYNSLNHRIFPTHGISHTLGGEVVIPGANLQYYKLTYDLAWFYPLTESERWIFNVSSCVGFGNGYGKTPTLPFYRNYTAGGSRLVRGYKENSLGPKDDKGLPFGGNTLLAGSVSLIFPTPFCPDSKSVRTALFFDAGQVYDTRYRTRVSNGVTIHRNPTGLRYSVGGSVLWNSPFGPINLSLAMPLNAKKGVDSKELFAFSAGTQF